MKYDDEHHRSPRAVEFNRTGFNLDVLLEYDWLHEHNDLSPRFCMLMQLYERYRYRYLSTSTGTVDSYYILNLSFEYQVSSIVPLGSS